MVAISLSFIPLTIVSFDFICERPTSMTGFAKKSMAKDTSNDKTENMTERAAHFIEKCLGPNKRWKNLRVPGGSDSKERTSNDFRRCVSAAFSSLERISSSEEKAALTQRLKSFDVRSLESLPPGTRKFFQRLFGPRHFSIKCAARSVIFSVLSLLVSFAILFLAKPVILVGLSQIKSNETMVNGMKLRDIATIGEYFYLVWFAMILVVDYIML